MSGKKKEERRLDWMDWEPGKHGYSPKPSGKKPVPPQEPSANIPVPDEEAPKRSPEPKKPDRDR